MRLITRAKLVFALKTYSFIGLLGTFAWFTDMFIGAYLSSCKCHVGYVDRLGEGNIELAILISFYVAMALYVVLRLTNKTHTISK